MLNSKFLSFLLSVITLVNSVSCAVLDDESSSRIFEAEINKTLEEFKQFMKEGDVELGIPPLDPWNIDLVNFPLDIKEILEVNTSASDIFVTGVSSFFATELKFNLLTMTLDYTILVPNVEVGGLYNLNGILLQFIPAFGNGTFGAETTNLKLSGYIKLSLFPQSIKDLKLLTSLENMDFSLTGLMDNEVLSQSLVNTLNEHVGPIINTYKEEISQIVSPILKDILNSFIK